MLFHADVAEQERRHRQAASQIGNRREEHFLEQLQVAVVAQRQVRRHHRDLVGQSLKQVALAPDQFPDVGILLVRHDARPGGQFGRI